MAEDIITELQSWLMQLPQERNITEGALLLLRLNHNRVLYDNVTRNPQRYAAIVERELRRHLDYRLRKLTHAQVESMRAEVARIVQTRLTKTVQGEDAHLGRRDDHDRLPAEIQQLYVDNLALLHKLRELHLQLRLATRSAEASGLPCLDSEQYPYLQEMIDTDKLMRANWRKYDEYDQSEE